MSFRILISNIVVLNGGDGAILFGMVKILKRAFGQDVIIRVFCSCPDAAKRMYPDLDFQETIGLAACRTPFDRFRYLGRIASLLQQLRYKSAAFCVNIGLPWACILLPKPARKAMLEYASADLIVTSGGTYLKDEYGITTQMCDCQIALILKRPLVFFTQSIGPLNLARSRSLFQRVINRVQCILVRDQISEECVRSFRGPTPTLYQCADAAFALGDRDELRVKRCEKARKKVAVSVREWPYFSSDLTGNYRQAIAAACEWLVSQGYEVTFISTCQGNPEYTDDGDEADKIVGLMSAACRFKVKVCRDYIRFDQLMGHLKAFDFVIATRMHVAILSLISGVPVLPVAYEFKTAELFEQLRMGKWVTQMDNIQSAKFVATVAQFVDQRDKMIADGLFLRVANMCENAMESGEYTKKYANTLHS